MYEVPVTPLSLLSIKCCFPWLIHPATVHRLLCCVVNGTVWAAKAANAFPLNPSAHPLKPLPVYKTIQFMDDGVQLDK